MTSPALPRFWQAALEGESEPFPPWSTPELGKGGASHEPGEGRAPSSWLTTSLLTLLTPSQGRGSVAGGFVTHLSYHYLLLGMCYEQWSDLLSVHSHHFLKRLHCFVETGGHDRMGGTGVL